MNKDYATFCLVLSLFLPPSATSARPQPAFHLGAMVEASDLVVLARLADIQRMDATEDTPKNVSLPSGAMRATYEVVERYRCIPDQEIGSVAVRFPSGAEAPSWQDNRKGAYSILFLKHGTQGGYEFTDTQWPDIPVGRFVSGHRREGGSLRERLGELLEASLESRDPDSCGTAVLWAERIGHRLSDDALAPLSAAADPTLRAIALMAWIRRGRTSMIPEAVTLLVDEGVPKIGWRGRLALAVEEAAEHVDVEQAKRLADSADGWIRRTGMRILRTKAEESSVPILLKGLDVDDPDTQYSAIVGLCHVAGVVGPPFREFLRNRDVEIARWRTWAEIRTRAEQSAP